MNIAWNYQFDRYIHCMVDSDNYGHQQFSTVD